MKVTYSPNNSGGDWWLSDKDWYALENNGWGVEWVKNRLDSKYKFLNPDTDGRWRGALAKKASFEGTMKEAIESFEAVTGQDSSALGCSCCGPPHSFSSDEGDYYSPSYPENGDRYDE